MWGERVINSFHTVWYVYYEDALHYIVYTTIMHLSYHSKGIHLTNRDTDTFGRSALHENYQYTK